MLSSRSTSWVIPLFHFSPSVPYLQNGNVPQLPCITPPATKIPQREKIQNSSPTIIGGKKSVARKKKWSGGEGDSQRPQSTNTHPEKPAPSQELMMRTGPVASREAFERPPWQGWELSPTNSALGSGYGPSPTVRPPSACPQAPGHHHCPSVQALGPLQARS